MVKKNLDVDDMKIIVRDIIKEELADKNIDLSVFPVTFIGYYNEYLCKKSSKIFSY